jgi:ubiquinone/menaquinone biosynthesis C-methylase UbiE
MTTVVSCAQPASVTPGGLSAIKARQQAMWASGDFAVVGTTLQMVGEHVCEAVDLRSTERVLDVAAGNGNATLAAARRFASVVSTDYVPSLLARGSRRAEAEGLPVRFQTADAEALPFDDASFDVVLSTFGVMFAPDHEAAAREMARVCRPGGRIGLAAWTPDGFIGGLLGVVGRHVPPPPGVRPSSLWGTETHVQTLFGDAAQRITHQVRTFPFRYRSAEHFVEVFRSYYGPVHKAFAALDPAGQRAFEDDLLALLHQWDQGDARGLVVPGDYLETVVTRR